MPTADSPVPIELVPDRACGPCNVCCVALTIDDPELQKVQGYRCRNAQRDGGCAIYDARPQTCRTFYCGWRQLKWVRETLRPDLSGVLVRINGEIGKTGQRRLGIVVTLLTSAAIKAEGLTETVAAGVKAGVPVYLNIPGPPGYTSGQARINEVMADAVADKDKPAMLRILREARAQGRAGESQPIVLKAQPATPRRRGATERVTRTRD